MRGFGDVHFGSVGFSLRRKLLGAGVCETRKRRSRSVPLVAQAILPVPALKRGADRGCLACSRLRSFVVRQRGARTNAECVAPTALRRILASCTQPFRAGLTCSAPTALMCLLD